MKRGIIIIPEIEKLRAENELMRDVLLRLKDMCGDRNVCLCGRPTGTPALVSCIETALAKLSKKAEK